MMEKTTAYELLANGYSEPTLDGNQCQEMLNLARKAIRNYLTTGSIKKQKFDGPFLNKKAAVFVTLWSPILGKRDPSSNTSQRLRGCVGRIDTDTPLYIGIQESAVSAATKDPRFTPISIAELDKLKIEIAVLSPLRMINDLEEIIVGKHGLMINGLNKRGLLLPKVAKRMGWNRLSYFHAICEKAGMSYDSWPQSATLFCFTTVTAEE